MGRLGASRASLRRGDGAKKPLAVVTGVVALSIAMFAGGALFPHGSSDGTPPGATADIRLTGLASETIDVTSEISSLKQRIKGGGPNVAADQASLAFAYLQKARVEADPAFYDKAEDALASSFDTQADNNFSATLGTAILAGSRHDFRGQLEWARRALQTNPYNSEALGILGDAHLELGATNKALAAYQKMIDLRPNLSSFGRVSYAAQLAGDSAGALRAMQRALQFAGSSQDMRAWAHWQLGELHIAAHRFDRAEEHLDKALMLAPDFGSALESTAHLAAARGDIESAIAILSSLVKDFPLPSNYAFLGELHILDRDKAAAQRAFAQADQRLSAYEAHGVRPDVDFITFWADRRIRLKRALREARLLYMQRKSAAVSDSLAWALYANGRPREAQKYAKEAIRRSVGDAGYHYHAGMIARAVGKDSAARELLKKALELDPSWSILESHRARRISAGRK